MRIVSPRTKELVKTTVTTNDTFFDTNRLNKNKGHLIRITQLWLIISY